VRPQALEGAGKLGVNKKRRLRQAATIVSVGAALTDPQQLVYLLCGQGITCPFSLDPHLEEKEPN